MRPRRENRAAQPGVPPGVQGCAATGEVSATMNPSSPNPQTQGCIKGHAIAERSDMVQQEAAISSSIPRQFSACTTPAAPYKQVAAAQQWHPGACPRFSPQWATASVDQRGDTQPISRPSSKGCWLGLRSSNAIQRRRRLRGSLQVRRRPAPARGRRGNWQEPSQPQRVVSWRRSRYDDAKRDRLCSQHGCPD